MGGRKQWHGKIRPFARFEFWKRSSDCTERHSPSGKRSFYLHVLVQEQRRTQRLFPSSFQEIGHLFLLLCTGRSRWLQSEDDFKKVRGLLRHRSDLIQSQSVASVSLHARWQKTDKLSGWKIGFRIAATQPSVCGRWISWYRRNPRWQ